MDGLTGRQDLAAEGIDLSGNSGEALLAGYLHVSDNDLQRMYHGLIAQPASNGNGEMHNGGLFEVDAWANGDGETHDHTRERHHANAGLGNGDYRGMSPGFSLSMSPPRPVMVAGAGAALSLHGSPGASLPDNASMLQMQSAYMQLQPTTSQADLRLLPESVEPQIMHLPAQLRARVAELQAKLDKHCQVFLEVAGSTDPTKAMELAALPAGGEVSGTVSSIPCH